nr:transcriptional repressor [Acinetobacter guerrae]
MSKELNSVIMSILHSERLRATIPRIMVLNVLIEKDKELTAIDIERIISSEHGKNLYISTIYSALKVFEDIGLIQKFKIGDQQSLYCIKKKNGSIRATCNQCKKTFFLVDDELEAHIESYAKSKELKLMSFSLLIKIKCENCRG